MSPAEEKALLQQGIAAARAGDKATARARFRELTAHNFDNELAWLWLASVADTPAHAMACLRPGGLAVHTFSYDLTPSGRSIPSTERVLIQQGDIERIALLLVSRGHEVAQFKIDASDPILTLGSAEGAEHRTMDRTMVGLIARRVPLPD